MMSVGYNEASTRGVSNWFKGWLAYQANIIHEHFGFELMVQAVAVARTVLSILVLAWPKTGQVFGRGTLFGDTTTACGRRGAKIRLNDIAAISQWLLGITKNVVSTWRRYTNHLQGHCVARPVVTVAPLFMEAWKRSPSFTEDHEY